MMVTVVIMVVMVMMTAAYNGGYGDGDACL